MWIRIGILVLIGGLVAACGRVSKPIAPEDSTYPYPYAVTQDAE